MSFLFIKKMGIVLSYPSLPQKEVRILSKETGLSSQEIQNLYKRFKKLDRDKSGTLSPDEFLAIPELSMNPLAERILILFQKEQEALDSNNLISTEVDFRAFAKTLSIFSKTTKSALKAKALFIVLDVDQNGIITKEDIRYVFSGMVGNWMDEREIDDIVNRIFDSPDFVSLNGQLRFEDFFNVLDSRNLIHKLTIDLEKKSSQ